MRIVHYWLWSYFSQSTTSLSLLFHWSVFLCNFGCYALLLRRDRAAHIHLELDEAFLFLGGKAEGNAILFLTAAIFFTKTDLERFKLNFFWPNCFSQVHHKDVMSIQTSQNPDCTVSPDHPSAVLTALWSSLASDPFFLGGGRYFFSCDVAWWNICNYHLLWRRCVQPQSLGLPGNESVVNLSLRVKVSYDWEEMPDVLFKGLHSGHEILLPFKKNLLNLQKSLVFFTAWHFRYGQKILDLN